MSDQEKLFFTRRLASYHAYFCNSSDQYPRSIQSFNRMTEIGGIINNNKDISLVDVVRLIEDYENRFQPTRTA